MKKVRGGRTVPREAVIAIIAMVESSFAIRSMNLLDPEHAPRSSSSTTSTAHSTNGSNGSAARSATPSKRGGRRWHPRPWMRTCWRKRLAKEPRYADLAAHVATIGRHLDRTNGTTKRKKGQEQSGMASDAGATSAVSYPRSA